MKRDILHKYGALLVYGLALLLCAFALGGCALLPCPVDEPAARLADTIQEAAQDGSFDETDFKLICRDAAWVEVALEEKAKPWTPPTTGIPWIDGALALGGLAASVFASVKTTNIVRDRKRKKRGEPTEVKSA